MQKLEEVAEQLPPEMYREVQHFAEFLLQKYTSQPRAKPEFKWAGALKELREDYSSVELQHKLAEWREES